MVANNATTIRTHLVKTAQKFHSIYMFSYGMCQQGRVDSKKPCTNKILQLLMQVDLYSGRKTLFGWL